jgi:septum formation inhibitor-activating ATPase MinD
VPGVHFEEHISVRIPIQKFLDVIMGAAVAPKKHREKQPAKVEKVSVTSKKPSLLDRLRKEKAVNVEPPDAADREFGRLSREISRVIAITGCRGSGVTSTAVNLAQIANNKQMSAILVDLDTENCTCNLYFNEYYEMADRNEDVAYSLIRNLAKPQDYQLHSYQNQNLFVTSLAYSFRDKNLLERFYTSEKLVNLISVFRKHFQLCLLDMPLSVLARLKGSMLYIDGFGLCVPNNLYALTGTLRKLQSVFTSEEMELFFSKSKIVVSKYNDRSSVNDEFFSPEKVCELLLELSDVLYGREFDLAGHIPYHMDFDSQLERDIPIVDSDAHMEKAYSEIFLRMFKGAR